MKNIFNKILFLLLISLSSFGAIPDSLINHLKLSDVYVSHGLHIGINQTFKVQGLKWLFFPYDDFRLLSKNPVDTGFKVVEATGFDTEDEETFKGVGWFKALFKIPANKIGKIFYLNFDQEGASEIYLDKKLLRTFGYTDIKGKTVLSLSVENLQIPIYINDTLVHEVSVRYSLSDYAALEEKYDFKNTGFELTFSLHNDKDYFNSYAEIYQSIMNMLAAFFFSLFLIHLLIYLFYKEKSFNLQYALFLLFLSLSFFEVYFVRHLEETHEQLIFSTIDNLFFPSCCFLLITLLYGFLNKPKTKSYYFFSIVFILFVIDTVFFIGFNNLLTPILILYAYFSSLVLAIKGIKRRIPSAKFLSWGILGFTLSLIVGIIIALLMTKLNTDSLLYFLVAALIFSVLSIPLSMTAYLAYDFAYTNNFLKKQLTENEELSKRSMQQEKEKQEILADQNKNLEHQVLERTKEIASQNRVLELQKKEITDSINYAKRIQQALLPDLENIQKALPNSFVFYLPKDIVSGDFYFFHENKISQKRSEILIAAADCTGHGVPGSLMSMIVHEKLENSVKETSEPGEILQKLNKQVKDALKQNITENASRDGCDIALCKITENSVTYSGAYRPLYVYNKNGEFNEIKATKTAIAGITPYDQIFTQTELKTADLKAIYLFSDGYADQFGGEKSKKLTTKKFKLLLSGLVNLPIHEQKREIESFFTKWRGQVEQIDDVLIIGILF